ncbi:MAG: hypothetical protein A2945_00965 [Candidatus Liptonbacteria bacterium RIFCSPLOWO2_01_FULL_52_25]|uniref:Uncharacterized protein n=1 Tax=Candidatus Liptonbacteria bacterium RIFCSPLOWO2_01_FULL_52_25 TaxID=1798650 RepID=A0A1G2CDY0_9BACT|nr:MAG: hypothetical protein A2945_00965 [Candidatus Liptonbacteria bacterium RIFCSPLOWO2_01_FULL_52_25]
MSKQNHERAEQSEESKEIDRILAEAYALMYRRQKWAKEGTDESRRQLADAESELIAKIDELKRQGMRSDPGELDKLVDSLKYPKLTKY